MVKITNVHTYLAIAEESLAEAEKYYSESRSPKPKGEPGFIIKYDTEQKSFKSSLIAIAFACNYLEATFYLVGEKKFGRTHYLDKIDRKPYQEKVLNLGISDQNLIDAADRLGKTRKLLVHEKAKDLDSMNAEDWRFAQEEARNAVTLVKIISKQLMSE